MSAPITMDKAEKGEGYDLSETTTGSHDAKVDIAGLAADDEAAQVLSQYDGPSSWSDEEEKRLRRKVDWKLMPLLCVTYGLQYYDKAMLSQAALFGILEELDLTGGTRYSFSSAIFYLGFIAGAYPAVILAQRYPIERVASGIVVVWGLCLLLTIECTNYQGLFAQRFFLGFLESGVSPMFMMIVGSWYKKDEQALRMGMWYSMTGYSAVFSPLINYGLGQVKSTLLPWKYMYIFAGSLTITWGILLLFILPPDPIRARGFDHRQRYILVARLRTNNAGVRNKRFKVKQAVELLCDVKFWLLFFISLLGMITNGPVSTFVPIIIRGLGYGTLDSLLLAMPAGAWIGTMMVFTGWLAYKYSKRNIRTWIVFATHCVTVMANALLWKLPRSETGGLLFAVYTLATYAAGYGVVMGICVANTSGYTKRSLASSGLFMGYCIGNFIGPLVFLESESPSYNTGFTVTTVTAAIAAVLIVVYRYVCLWDNKRRDRNGTIEAYDHAYEDPTDITNKQFRYVL